jgi:hypothetical protein
VDSFDFDVLRGGHRTLERFNPWIVIELNHALAKRNQSVNEALEGLVVAADTGVHIGALFALCFLLAVQIVAYANYLFARKGIDTFVYSGFIASLPIISRTFQTLTTVQITLDSSMIPIDHLD